MFSLNKLSVKYLLFKDLIIIAFPSKSITLVGQNNQFDYKLLVCPFESHLSKYFLNEMLPTLVHL